MSRYDDLLGFRFPTVRQTYTERDTIIYALGVGADTLDHVYERDLVALPSMAVTLAYPGFWYRDLRPGLDFTRTVHASERFEVFGPLPTAATVAATPAITAIHDKGAGRGSLVESRREVVDVASGRVLAVVTQTAFCRGDGDLGGPQHPAPAAAALPDRAPDRMLPLPTSARAAMIYRLSGDLNPLHVDPTFAAEAGFPRPILHGLCTYGHLCRALVGMPDRGALTSMDCRFTAPVFPGETLDARFWLDADVVRFQAFVGERRVVDNGIALFSPSPKSLSANPKNP